ncbi:hypothetical protein CNMCM6457_006282 [Aspergillus fumigatiaffinis]|nr:hypothetical protein CNMCM6457_006282 [Aspergillus fumigatiaffinis]
MASSSLHPSITPLCARPNWAIGLFSSEHHKSTPESHSRRPQSLCICRIQSAICPVDDLEFTRQRQARNERRRQRRRTPSPVVVGSSSLGSPPSDLLLNSSLPSIDDNHNDPFEEIVWNESAVLHSQKRLPFKLPGNSYVLRTLGLDPDFGDTLIRTERTGLDESSRGYAGLWMLRMHPQKAAGALAALYEKIHIWYPILPLGFPEQYFHILSGTLAPSAESCLALLVAAVGCVVQDEEKRSRHGLNERSDLAFFEAAVASLPIIQNWLKILIGELLPGSHDTISEDAEKLGLTNRAYWAALLLEKYVAIVELACMASLTMHYSSELSDQLDIVKSDWNYDEYIPLSDCRRTWVPAIPRTESGPEAASPTTVPSPSSIAADTSESYFLAEIAMRRMLHRWNTATRQTSDRGYENAPGMALEHDHQLESWYNDLPETIRLKKIEDHPISPGAASVFHCDALLRPSFACNIIAANCPSTARSIPGNFGRMDDMCSTA